MLSAYENHHGCFSSMASTLFDLNRVKQCQQQQQQTNEYLAASSSLPLSGNNGTFDFFYLFIGLVLIQCSNKTMYL